MCPKNEMCEKDMEMYKRKIERVAHLEKIGMTVFGLFLAALYFVLTNFKGGLGTFVGYTLFLVCLSISYGHIMIIYNSYMASIREMEDRYGWDLYGPVWKRYKNNLIITYSVIALAPMLLTMVAIIIMATYHHHFGNYLVGLLMLYSYIFAANKMFRQPVIDMFNSMSS